MSEYKLGDVAEILIGGTPSRNNSSYWQQGEGGYNWVAISDLKRSKIISSTKERITEKGTEYSNVKLIPKGSLIMSFKLSIGRCAITGKDLYTNEAIAAFLPKESHLFEPEFLYYSLPVIDFTLLTDVAVKGATLNKQKLKNIRLDIPPLPIQRKIARILSTIDGQIEKTEAIIAKYQAVKQGMLQDLFTRGIDVKTGQLRPRYEDAPDLYEDSSLGMIPKEWEVKRLEKLCNNVVDCPHSTPTYQDHGVLVARTMHIKKGRYNIEFSSRVPEEEYEERISRLKPQEGDLIFTREAPVGEAFIIPKGMRICLGQRVMLLRPNQNLCLPEFLLETIYSPELQSRLDNMVGGTTAHHVNVADMKNLLLKTPEPDEQKKMVALFQTDRNKMHQEISSLSKLQLLKQGLMQDLLSGKVEVTA